ncbi:MAG: FecR domain-containing protein [Chitinophagaceae bacterium]|nr:FecR domain-containing protein [Chitinophagaceae bacterium]
MPQSEHIQDLIRKAAAGQATSGDLEELAQQLRLDESGEVTRAVEEHLKIPDISSLTSQVTDWRSFAQQIIAAGKQTPVRRIGIKRFAWMRYAAAVIIIIGIAAYLWNSQNNHSEKNNQTDLLAAADSIPPGTDRAILTLADGRTIALDSAANGRIARQSGSTILKKQGQIVYEAAAGTGNNNSSIAINTMSTPRGGQYQLVLPDGTRVWLNAASSISYPTAFVKDRREVKVKGEVYFEVAKNAKKPFVVDVNGSLQVQVLGTHFNINSYENEASIKTTLLEGSVRIIRAGPTTGVADQSGNQVVIKPGEQAQLVKQAGKQIDVVRQVDLDQTMAWKNGIFNFNGLDVQGVLRQIERWYDVDVVYETKPASVVFKGEMYRNVHLSDVLEKLQEMSGVKFRMEGKKLIVIQ